MRGENLYNVYQPIFFTQALLFVSCQFLLKGSGVLRGLRDSGVELRIGLNRRIYIMYI